MFEEFNKIWKKWGFEIVVGMCILFFVFNYFLRKDQRGSWSTNYYYKKESMKHPPRESRGETECRRTLEKIFNKPFPKVRPNFLQNPVTGGEYNLELDCFCEELKLAVEYSGIQHYKYVPYFHKNKDAFHNLRYRDYLKKRMCKDNGVVLVEVPYTVKVEEIYSYLVKNLKNLGYING